MIFTGPAAVQAIGFSGAAAVGLFDTALQAIQVGKTVLPTQMSRFHIDMPSAAENRHITAPITGHLDSPRGTGSGVVIRAHQLAGEGQ